MHFKKKIWHNLKQFSVSYWGFAWEWSKGPFSLSFISLLLKDSLGVVSYSSIITIDTHRQYNSHGWFYEFLSPYTRKYFETLENPFKSYFTGSRWLGNDFVPFFVFLFFEEWCCWLASLLPQRRRAGIRRPVKTPELNIFMSQLTPSEFSVARLDLPKGIMRWLWPCILEICTCFCMLIWILYRRTEVVWNSGGSIELDPRKSEMQILVWLD